MRISIALLVSGFLTVAAAGQANTPADSPSTEVAQTAQAAPAQNSFHTVTIPAGTRVLLQLRSPIDTRSAHVGDGVYCQTSFPVTQDDVVVIPAGTYVKGEIAHVERAGRIKGRAQILFHFNTMIFPNGYSEWLYGGFAWITQERTGRHQLHDQR